MDQTTTTIMDSKKPPARLVQQSAKSHVQDHKEVNKKGSNGYSRRQRDWEHERDSVAGWRSSKATNGGAGATAAKGASGRFANKATRNKEKEGGQVDHFLDWSHADFDDDYYSSQPYLSRGARQQQDITRSFQDWWGGSRWHGAGRNRAGGGRQVGGSGRRNHRGYRGSASSNVRISKERALQARCQFVVNPNKEAEQLAKSLVPVGFAIADQKKQGLVLANPGCAYKSSLDVSHTLATPVTVNTPDGGETASDEDPDTPVWWAAVEEVLLHMTQPTHCPVCLYPPVAPQVTKCGHIYCYPCILHYLALSDKKWRSCPICYEVVVRDDLKSAVCVLHPDYGVGSSIEMSLMRRSRHSMQPLPVVPQPRRTSHMYARKIRADRNKVLSILSRERSALEVQMSDEGTEPEACFIEGALALVQEREQRVLADYGEEDDDLSRVEQLTAGVARCTVMEGEEVEQVHEKVHCCEALSQRGPLYEVDNITNQLEERQAYSSHCNSAVLSDVVTTPDRTQLREVTCSDDSLNEKSSSLESSTFEMTSLEVVTPQPVAAHIKEHRDSLSRDSFCSPDGQHGKEDFVLSRVENLQFELERESPVASNIAIDVSAMSESTEAAAVTSVSFGATPKHNMLKSTYYFYQASDGSHVYLHSLSLAMLLKEYGSLEQCPPTITATIVEKEYGVMDEQMRQRAKYLRHVPLSCSYDMVELSLQPPLVSQQTIHAFQGSLKRREQQRAARAKEEHLIERRNLAQEQLELSTHLYARVASASSVLTATSEDGCPVERCSVSSDGASSTEFATSPPTDSSSQLQQPSFAKMVKEQKHKKSQINCGTSAWPSLSDPVISNSGTAWPRTGGGGWGSTKNSAPAQPLLVPSDDEQLFNAPDYSHTFSEGFDTLLQTAMAAAGEGSGGNRSRKGKNKLKKVVLFSSSGGF